MKWGLWRVARWWGESGKLAMEKSEYELSKGEGQIIGKELAFWQQLRTASIGFRASKKSTSLGLN